MHQKPIIAVDIDDVLSRTAQSIIDYSNERWGHAHSLEDFTEHLAGMWQIDARDAERRWLEYMESDFHSELPVIHEAKQALEKLKPHYTLIAVTSRRDSLIPISERWLDTHYKGIIERVVGAGIHGRGNANSYLLTKAEVLKDIGADYLIDDQPKHCIGAASVGVRAVLFGDYPWQVGVELPEWVSRCGSWGAVTEYFDEL